MLYTVRAGDTLATIASRFNTTVQAIAQANDITNVDLIRVGQVLIIPPSVPTPTPAGATPATPLPTTTR